MTLAICRTFWIGLCGSLLLVLPAQAVGPEAPASRKLALIIANSSYTATRLALRNPENDGVLVGQSFSKLGFEVTQAFNLNRTQMLAAVTDFSKRLPRGATAVVFYAGHGMQIGGASYLLPVDMALTSEQSVPLRAVAVNTLLDTVSQSEATVNIVVLDACRDNPFQPTPATRYRGVSSLGLGQVTAPRGTFIAYSTAPGQLAADGAASNSLYSATLARVMLEPGLSLESIFHKVGEQVRKKTLDDQIPWYESSISGEYYFQPPAGAMPAPDRSGQTAALKTGAGGISRGVKAPSAVLQPAWFRSMEDYEWSNLDYQIQQRVKFMTRDEVPVIEHKAKGGSVVAQMALAMFWLEGTGRISVAGSSQVTRYDANNTQGIYWLRMAAKAEFPIAQAELGERLYQGHGVARDVVQARRLLSSAAESRYPRAKLDMLQVNMEAGNSSNAEVQNAIDSMMKSLSPKH